MSEDKPKLPYIYPSQMEIGETYTCTMNQRVGPMEKHGGAILVDISIEPAIVPQKGKMAGQSISRGKMWFDASGDDFNPKEWEFVELTAPLFDGGEFQVQRVGKPWRWRIVIDGQVQEGTQVAHTQPAPQAPAPQTVQSVSRSINPINQVNDQIALMGYLWSKLEEDGTVLTGERTDTVKQALASTLFIQACREGADKEFAHWLKNTTDEAPQAEGDLPF